MAYDSKCYDLAGWFLSDVPELSFDAKRHELAQVIQTAIEDWIEWERTQVAPIRGSKDGDSVEGDLTGTV